jgi:hypothetical protein
LRITFRLLGLLLACLAVGTGDARGGRPELAVAGGYSGATVDIDTEGLADDQISGNGVGIALRIGLRARWGLQINQTWVDSNDRVFTSDTISFRALHLHGFWAWRPQREFRPYVKLGATAFDFEADPGAGATVRSDSIAPSFGGGFEWGSRRFGFIFDVGFAPTELDLTGDHDESVFVGNTTAGLFYRFGQAPRRAPPPDSE